MEGMAALVERLKSRGLMTSTDLKNGKSRTVHGTYNLSPEAMERNKETILKAEEAQAKCKGCKGNCWQGESSRGMVPVLNIFGDNVYEAVRMCRYEKQRRQQEKLHRLFRSAKVPMAYTENGFGDYKLTRENADAVKAAQWVVGDDSGQGLFIYGPRGTGKTMLAAIIANERMRKGKPVLFSNVPELLGDIRATFHTGTTEEALRNVKAAAFLVLDDFGAERMTEWVGEQLFAIVNYRYNEKLPTIITSNYGKKEIIERMAIVSRDGSVVDDMQGKRIMSRVFGMCKTVFLGGEDYRLRRVRA